MVISKHGIIVQYTCYKRPQKCPDSETDKCMTCKFCKAEMDAYDATRLLRGAERREKEKLAEMAK